MLYALTGHLGGGCVECRACAIPRVCRFLFNYLLGHAGLRFLEGVAALIWNVVDWTESSGSCKWDSRAVSYLTLIDLVWTCCDVSMGIPVLSASAVPQ